MKIESPFEEKLNSITHAIGAILGVIGLFFLLDKKADINAYSFWSCLIYGFSIIILFTASTLYHATKKETLKHYFRIVDHISIYLLIAGTYTPVLLISLEHSLGWTLLYTIWGFAFFGVILKLFFTGRFEFFSVLLYIIMGWLIVLDFNSLKQNMDSTGILLLIAGGIFYTGGIFFYAKQRIPYNHVIWHCFVLAGAISHFAMVYYFVV